MRDELGYDPARITLIPHGALDYLTSLPDEAPLPPELGRVERPVVLCFGLIRPHKGVEVALEAFRSVPDAELWVVGMPRMPLDRVRESEPDSPRTGGATKSDTQALLWTHRPHSWHLHL